MNKHWLSAAGLATMLLAGSTMAVDDRQNINGGSCDNYFAGQEGDFNHQSNGIRNTSNASRSVYCPITMDEVANTGGTTYVWVRWTGTGTMSCTIVGWDVNDTSLGFQSASGPEGWFSLPNITSEDTWTTYGMYCSLPAGGRLEKIAVREASS